MTSKVGIVKWSYVAGWRLTSVKPKAAPAASASTSKAPSTPAPAAAATPAVPAAPTHPTTAPANAPATPSPAPSAPPAEGTAFNDPSALTLGSQRDEAIANMEAMGFPRAEIDRAMRAAFYNPDRAVDYLLNVCRAIFEQLAYILLSLDRASPKMYSKNKLNPGMVQVEHLQPVHQLQLPHPLRQAMLPRQPRQVTMAISPSTSSKLPPKPAAPVARVEVLVALAEQLGEQTSQGLVLEWEQRLAQVLKVAPA